jgi:hypothetical protein
LEETIHFGTQASAKFTYALEQASSIDVPNVRYTRNKVTVLIPADQANTWCATDQVGIVDSLSIGSFGSLDLLIEKDFACLDQSDEDNEDTFANPSAGSTC